MLANFIMDETVLLYCELSSIGQQVLREMANYNCISLVFFNTSKKVFVFFPWHFYTYIVEICSFHLLIL